MKNIIAIFLIFYSSINRLIACECPEVISFEDRERSYTESDVVLLGRLIKSDGDIQTIDVLEILKGSINSSSFDTKNSNNCSLEISGLWLLYGTYDSDGSIEISICSASRSLENTTPQLQFLFESSNSLDDKIILENKISQEFRELYSDIQLYRNRKQVKRKRVKSNSIIILILSWGTILILLTITFRIRAKEAFK